MPVGFNFEGFFSWAEILFLATAPSGSWQWAVEGGKKIKKEANQLFFFA